MAIYPKAETWKPITGYENYEVSDIGNVKSTNFNRTGKARLLKPYINGTCAKCKYASTDMVCHYDEDAPIKDCCDIGECDVY